MDLRTLFFKPKVILIMASISGLMATYLVHAYVNDNNTPVTALERDYRKIVVARQDLKIGQVLVATDLELKNWPRDLLPRDYFTSIGDVLGRSLKVDVDEAEVLRESKFAPTGSNGGVSSLIPQGWRAITVPVNVVSGVGGFILPNARVDVLTTVSTSGNKAQTATKMILQNIKVLAVDQTYEASDDDPRAVQSVTLLVKPSQAEVLALAAAEGELQLILRNGSDSDFHNTGGKSLNQLVNKPRKKVRKAIRKAAKADPPVEHTRVVEVIRSNERSEVTFKEEN